MDKKVAISKATDRQRERVRKKKRTNIFLMENKVKWNVLEFLHKALDNLTLVQVLCEVCSKRKWEKWRKYFISMHIEATSFIEICKLGWTKKEIKEKELLTQSDTKMMKNFLFVYCASYCCCCCCFACFNFPLQN